MTPIRTFLGALGAEVNTFSPTPLGRSDFETVWLYRAGTIPPDCDPPLLAAPLKRARELQSLGLLRISQGLCGGAQPGGLINRETYEALRDELLADLSATCPVDMVLLGLHGATAAQGYDDCEADILRLVRDLVGPNAVIAALLDPHAHLSEAMVGCSDLLMAYKEYPHDDIFQVATQMVDAAVALAQGRSRAATRVFDCRTIGTFNTYTSPMRELVDDMIATTAAGADVIDISIAHGFPWGDVADMGAKVWVTTDGDPALAGRLAETWGRRLVSLREAMTPQLLSIDDLVRRARSSDGPLIVADTTDNPGGGAPSDNMAVVAALRAAGIEDVAAALIWDPVAVGVCLDAGEGARLDLRVGGKASRFSGSPLDLEVEVRKIVPELRQPFGGGFWSTGPVVCVSAGATHLVLTARRTQCFATECFSELGVDPAAQKVLVVKSSNHFEASFRSLGFEIVRVEAGGVLTHDFSRLDYRKARRPIWPLDDDAMPQLLDWRGHAEVR